MKQTVALIVFLVTVIGFVWAAEDRVEKKLRAIDQAAAAGLYQHVRKESYARLRQIQLQLEHGDLSPRYRGYLEAERTILEQELSLEED